MVSFLNFHHEAYWLHSKVAFDSCRNQLYNCVQILIAKVSLVGRALQLHENGEVLPSSMRPAKFGDNNSNRRALPLNYQFAYRFQ